MALCDGGLLPEQIAVEAIVAKLWIALLPINLLHLRL
jgi:hypothetical protein